MLKPQSLLDAGKIPFQNLDGVRLIREEDLLEYKREEEKRAKLVLDELAAEGQRLKLE